MYQIKCSGGYEIRVIGKGENGLCVVAKATSAEQAEKFRGTYAECRRWLSDRGVRELSVKASE